MPGDGDGDGIADPDEYRRALAATSHVRGPDLSKAGQPRVVDVDVDDDELQRAIAMSLREAGPLEVIGDDDDEDEELARALRESAEEAASAEIVEIADPSSKASSSREVIEISSSEDDNELAQQPPRKRARLQSSSPPPPYAAELPAAKRSNNNPNGYDRKAMEAERLERQRKLKGGDKDLYWKGEVRPTFNKLAPSDKSFTLKELIGDDPAPKLIIAAGFVWDLEWLASAGIFPDPQLVPTLLIMHPNTDADNGQHGRVSSGGLEGAVVQHAFLPKAPGAAHASGTQHMKFMLVVHKDRLRVVVTSANFVDYDWERINNIVFVQDIPRLTTPSSAFPNHSFPQAFRRLFTRPMDIRQPLQFLNSHHAFGRGLPFRPHDDFACLAEWDWSKVTAELVVSVAGTYRGAELERMGKTGLAAIIRRRGWLPPKGASLHAEFQSSSLHAFSPGWNQRLYACFQGKTAAVVLAIPSSGRGAPTTFPPIKVIFPSLKTVEESICGKPGGGTMFCNPSNYKTIQQKDLYYDANCKDGKVLMHTKMIIATWTGGNSNAGDGVGGWVYLGSHNFSRAAWGTLNSDGQGLKLHCNNYEMGVVLPLSSDDIEAEADKLATWTRPPRKYGARDVPWMQKEHSAPTLARAFGQPM